ncbi:ABC transporter permease [Siphonobacter curvatus]|uniref:ABC transporter permease n=1 Tax=Siphonobacter curvatus TaxID=2094562 RepID=A0A2S7IMM6_9BACT|nr:ABC transporter permease [Siphonobacter curvatus]PQA58972.1 hypothetical protein C5O19_04755 [Siphonobacter curvatus]
MLLTYIPQSFRIEMLKTRNTAAFWLTVASAAFAPVLLCIGYLAKPQNFFMPAKAAISAWDLFAGRCWQINIALFLPFFIVLINSMVVNIEHRSNTWKYVFTQPFPKASVWLGKLLLIQALILLNFILFNLLILVAGFILSFINEKYGFGNQGPDLMMWLKATTKAYLATLAISGIHYWLATRIKNLIVPIGMALMGLVLATVLLQQKWEYIDWFPYAYTILSARLQPEGLLQKHEWISIGYFVVLNLIGYLDISRRNMG